MTVYKTIPRRLLLLVLLLAALTTCALAADADTFYAELEQDLREQKKSFTIHFDGDREELGLDTYVSFGALQRELMVRSPDGPDSADYPALNVNEAAVSKKGDAYNFTIDYLNTPEQLAEVDRRVEEIVDELALDGLDSETKATLIYSYVCSNFAYDKTYTKYTAYDGLTSGSMVCQGYAILTSKLLWEAGVPARIIAGTSKGEVHAWNIVQLDGQWYSIDATWDAVDEIGQRMAWNVFLKAERDFVGHEAFKPFSSQRYTTAHPFAEESRALQRVSVRSGGETIANLVVRVGVPVRLEGVLPEGLSGALQWSSSDPEVLEAGADGAIEAKRTGQVTLSVEAPSLRGVVPARVNVVTVDLRAASPWAFETVTEFYLGQFLPADLCEGFQDPLTRGELAELCYTYVLVEKGWKSGQLPCPFDDVREDPNAIAILRCNSVGIMEGISEDKFAPDEVVTREQAAAVLSRLIAYLTGETPQAVDGKVYRDDASISSWARESVSAMTGAGIFQGADGAFRPQDPISLQEAVIALDRVRSGYPLPEQEAA